MQHGGGFGRKGVEAGAIPANRACGPLANRGGFGAHQSHGSVLAADGGHDAIDEHQRRREALIAEIRAEGLSANDEGPRYHEAHGEAYAKAKPQYDRDNYYGRGDGAGAFGPAKLERSVGIAYLLWFFFGGFSAHRFYLGATQSAMVQAGLWLFGLALILTASWFSALGGFFLLLWAGWVLIDLFRIPAVHARFCRQ